MLTTLKTTQEGLRKRSTKIWLLLFVEGTLPSWGNLKGTPKEHGTTHPFSGAIETNPSDWDPTPELVDCL